MSSQYRIQVFGKLGCDKCTKLNERIERLLAQGGWEDFEKVDTKLDTVDGLVEFSTAECINPSRVPALLVLKKDPESGRFQRMPECHPGQQDKVFGNSRLYSYLGLQTDYSPTGSGVLTPKMLTTLMEEARNG